MKPRPTPKPKPQPTPPTTEDEQGEVMNAAQLQERKAMSFDFEQLTQPEDTDD